MRRCAHRGVVIFGCAVLSCSPFTTDGDPPGNAVDGGAPHAPGTAPEAGSGGGAPDATVGFCAASGGGATICDDFDVLPLGAAWSEGVATSGGGKLTLGADAFRSGPNALVARLPPTCGAAVAQLVAVRQVEPRTMEIAGSLSVESAPPTGAVHLFGTEIITSKGHYRLDLAFERDHLVLLENDAGSVRPFGAPGTFAKGTFARIEMVLVFADGPRARVSVDGRVQIDTPLLTPAPSQATSRFELGPYVEGSCDVETAVRFDDVVYTLSPR